MQAEILKQRGLRRRSRFTPLETAPAPLATGRASRTPAAAVVAGVALFVATAWWLHVGVAVLLAASTAAAAVLFAVLRRVIP